MHTPVREKRCHQSGPIEGNRLVPAWCTLGKRRFARMTAEELTDVRRRAAALPPGFSRVTIRLVIRMHVLQLALQRSSGKRQDAAAVVVHAVPSWLYS